MPKSISQFPFAKKQVNVRWYTNVHRIVVYCIENFMHSSFQSHLNSSMHQDVGTQEGGESGNSVTTHIQLRHDCVGFVAVKNSRIVADGRAFTFPFDGVGRPRRHELDFCRATRYAYTCCNRTSLPYNNGHCTSGVLTRYVSERGSNWDRLGEGWGDRRDSIGPSGPFHSLLWIARFYAGNQSACFHVCRSPLCSH